MTAITEKITETIACLNKFKTDSGKQFSTINKAIRIPQASRNGT